MRKQLGILTSFLFVSAMALVGFGCADNRYSTPVCEQPCMPTPCQPMGAVPSQPMCAAPCAPMPSACGSGNECRLPVKCKHPSNNQLCCYDFITVTASNPKMCLLGDQYPLDFDVKACDDVCDVVVTTHLPEGVSFIKSTPEAKVEGRKLTWNFGSMQKGECRPAKVVVKCECEGELCACFCATATPVRFCSLLCAKPILTCHKCGPEEVCPGDPVNYTITVTNKGTCTAEDVVITDNIPPEMEHSSCQKTLAFKLGSLEPCQTKTVNLCLTAVKRGNTCNTAIVSACNADTVSCQWCTCICCCGVDIIKTGPKEVAIGKNADYQITVTNTGDKPLTEVVVTDMAPNMTSIVAANGASITANQAMWRVKEIKVGEKVNFNVTLTTCTPGCFTDKAGVTTAQGCNACSEFTTRWKGRAALNVCIVESEDPICVKEHTTYTVDVVNQGSEDDNKVNVVVRFPAELKPVRAYGDTAGTISGQTVTFAPSGTLRAKQSMKYRVEAEGVASGDARVNVEVSSEAIKTPIMQQASTIVN
jgi:uncharacterized repeat protein (TIGR01451 family)